MTISLGETVDQGQTSFGLAVGLTSGWAWQLQEVMNVYIAK